MSIQSPPPMSARYARLIARFLVCACLVPCTAFNHFPPRYFYCTRNPMSFAVITTFGHHRVRPGPKYSVRRPARPHCSRAFRLLAAASTRVMRAGRKQAAAARSMQQRLAVCRADRRSAAACRLTRLRRTPCWVAPQTITGMI